MPTWYTEVLSAECVRLPPALRTLIALFTLFVLPCTQLWIQNLQKKPALCLLVGPAGRVFLVEFLLRPARLSVGRIIIAYAVLTTVVTAVTVLNYWIFHRTVLQNVRRLRTLRIIKFSIPRNVVQQLGTNLTMTLICRRLSFTNLSTTRLLAIGVFSLSLERIYHQWILFRNTSRVGRRVFISSKASSPSSPASPSADTSHWYIQAGRHTFDIFKYDGVVTARLAGDQSGDAAHYKDKDIPSSWLDTSYIPFLRYGVAGFCNETDKNEISNLVNEVYRGMRGVYSSSYQSCQEFAILSLCVLCDEPLYNMSDTKSLGPIALVLFFYYLFSSEKLLSLWSDIWGFVLTDLTV